MIGIPEGKTTRGKKQYDRATRHKLVSFGLAVVRYTIRPVIENMKDSDADYISVCTLRSHCSANTVLPLIRWAELAGGPCIVSFLAH
jgi:hypothetical protein